MGYVIMAFMVILILSMLYSAFTYCRFWFYFLREYPARARKFLWGGGIGVIASFFKDLSIDDEKLILLQEKVRKAYILTFSIAIAGAVTFFGLIGLFVVLRHFR
ncbi:MAG: hypothetical protein JW806_03010 [Sedimentisphaerales bacterium]|nr:hypothetical protein [Sedimentisphaerales bacterium]